MKRQKVIENQISFKNDLMKPLNDNAMMSTCFEDHVPTVESSETDLQM